LGLSDRRDKSGQKEIENPHFKPLGRELNGSVSIELKMMKNKGLQSIPELM